MKKFKELLKDWFCGHWVDVQSLCGSFKKGDNVSIMGVDSILRVTRVKKNRIKVRHLKNRKANDG